jgi:hypothetical protein
VAVSELAQVVAVAVEGGGLLGGDRHQRGASLTVGLQVLGNLLEALLHRLQRRQAQRIVEGEVHDDQVVGAQVMTLQPGEGTGGVHHLLTHAVNIGGEAGDTGEGGGELAGEGHLVRDHAPAVAGAVADEQDAVGALTVGVGEGRIARGGGVQLRAHDLQVARPHEESQQWGTLAEGELGALELLGVQCCISSAPSGGCG